MATKTTEKYIYAIGRRKTAIAQVRLFEAAKQQITVNGKDSDTFFKTDVLRRTVRDAFTVANAGTFRVEAKVSGGGVTGQAESIRLGIARALIEWKKELRKDLKKAGYLKRDPRAKERRKFGLKKARKSPQWSKR
jgi:small subunit ribosomal protein S9